MGPIWDAELRVWDAKNFGLVSPGTHRNKFVKKSLDMEKTIMVLNKVTKLHKILIKTIGLREHMWLVRPYKQAYIQTDGGDT